MLISQAVDMFLTTHLNVTCNVAPFRLPATIQNDQKDFQFHVC